MKKALFFGDSNTYGYDPAGFMGGRYPYEKRWTTILGDRLGQAWEIASDGLPGRATPATRREWDILCGSVQKQMPLALFAVMLGTNDLLSTLRPDAARTARRMNDLISVVEETLQGSAAEETLQGSPTEILLIAPPEIRLTAESYGEPYVRGDKTYAQIYYEEGKKLAEYYSELADYRGIRFADASQWDLDFAFDGVHLSEEGHAAFAREMEKVLREIDSFSRSER